MKGTRNIRLKENALYKNRGGGTYKALSTWTGGAIVRNVASGWTCTAHGVIYYDDGTIEWDYSTGGHFA